MLIELFYGDTQVLVTTWNMVAAVSPAASPTETWFSGVGGAFITCTRCKVDGEEHDLKTDDDRVWFMKRVLLP